jgi:ribosomal RNA assembly protein
MSFDQTVKVAADRIGALVGRGGKVKQEIEERCGVQLQVDGRSGDVHIKGREPVENMQPFKAVEIVNAIARGFSPERAFRLLNEETVLSQVDLREFVGKSVAGLTRVKGRLIGLGGKARRLTEELTGADISVYGHSVAIIGHVDEARLASEAVAMLASGSAHKTVYDMLQRARSRAKLERLKLWEDMRVG